MTFLNKSLAVLFENTILPVFYSSKIMPSCIAIKVELTFLLSNLSVLPTFINSRKFRSLMRIITIRMKVCVRILSHRKSSGVKKWIITVKLVKNAPK